MSNVDMNWETKDALWKAKQHWNTCLHEAAHAVMHIRTGYAVRKVWVKHEFEGITDFKVETDKPLPPPITTVAGHVAEHLWGYDALPIDNRCCGSRSDFDDIAILERWKRRGGRISKSDRAAAKAVWQKETRKLRVLAKRDPSFERQVKTVAVALSLKDSLRGDEVRNIMEAANISFMAQPV